MSGKTEALRRANRMLGEDLNKAESQLTALRAENVRLKQMLSDLKPGVCCQSNPVAERALAQTIQSLIAVARTAFTLCDNSEDNGKSIDIDRDDFQKLSDALDRLDALEDPPGEVATGPRKAEYQLRALLSEIEPSKGRGER